MTIPRDFIDSIVNRADIIEIIGSRIKLRKAGNNFITTCPFHNEKTPSFSVSAQKQFYYCFGCGEHGDVISFLMKFEHLNFTEAVQTLAAHLGLEIPEEHTSLQNQLLHSKQKKNYALLEKASVFYQKQLLNSLKAKQYLQKRGLKDEICQRFLIGYAPGRNELLRASRISKADISELFENGLLGKRDNGEFYDKFRERIIFPIRSRRGNIIAFGGRSLGSDMPKYLNSPETEIFHKGEELYGLYEARHYTKKLEKIIVVEGYMDVLTLAQYDISYAVASMGTAITIKQIQAILRETEDIIFCFDGDSAGQKAAWRALEIVLALMRDGLQVRFLFLPNSEDPDSYLHKYGKEKFLESLNNSMPLSEFFLKYFSAQLDLNTIDGRATLVHKAIDVLKRMPDSTFRDLLMQKLATKIGIEFEILHTSLKKSEGNLLSSNFKSNDKTPPRHILNTVEKAISLLLQYPNLVEEIPDLERLQNCTFQRLDLLLWLIKTVRQNKSISLTALLEQCPNMDDAKFLAELSLRSHLISTTGIKEEFVGIIHKLYLQAHEKEIEHLLQKANKVGLNDDEKIILQKLIKAVKY